MYFVDIKVWLVERGKKKDLHKKIPMHTTEKGKERESSKRHFSITTRKESKEAGDITLTTDCFPIKIKIGKRKEKYLL